MSAALNDAALLHDDDAVGVAHGGEAVSYHEGGTSAHQGVHAVLHQLLGARVYGGGGLVKYQHRRVGHSRTGYSYQLTLAL